MPLFFFRVCRDACFFCCVRGYRKEIKPVVTGHLRFVHIVTGYSVLGIVDGRAVFDEKAIFFRKDVLLEEGVLLGKGVFLGKSLFAGNDAFGGEAVFGAIGAHAAAHGDSHGENSHEPQSHYKCTLRESLQSIPWKIT